MDSSYSSQRKARSNPLERINMITFMESLVGEPVVAERIDDTEVSGILERVDETMKFCFCFCSFLFLCMCVFITL